MGSAPFAISVRIAGTAHYLYFNILPGSSIRVPAVKKHRSCVSRTPVTVRVDDLHPQEPVEGLEIPVLCCLHCSHGCVGGIIAKRCGSPAWMYGNRAGSSAGCCCYFQSKPASGTRAGPPISRGGGVCRCLVPLGHVSHHDTAMRPVMQLRVSFCSVVVRCLGA